MNNFLKHSLIIFFCSALSAPSVAQSVFKEEPQAIPWSITASLGMARFQYTEGLHGQTALGRLSFDYPLSAYLGLEVGIQNGTQLRFSVPQSTLDILGGVPIEGNIRPLLDVLVTAKTRAFSPTTPVYAQFKAGVAYRQLQMDRESINDRAEYAPEFQVGFGYKASERLDVNLMVQHVAGKNPNIQADSLTETGRIAHIPTQQALLFGLKLILE